MKPTLIFIPGWGADASLWEHQIKSLSDLIDPQVVVFDKQTSRDQMVEHLLNISPPTFILAGNSMGGWVALKAAAVAPKRITKLVLANTWASPDAKLNEIQKDLIRDLKNDYIDQVIQRHLPFTLHQTTLSNPVLIEKLKKMFESCKISMLINQMQAMLDDYSSLSLLNQIQVPTLIIHGREDQLFPTAEQELLHKQIKHSELKVIEQCGHISPLEHPEETTALIRQFLLI